MKPSHPNRSYGFTLIEILVVIFLAGAVAGVALPRMNRMIVQARVQRAAQALQTDVQQAFAIAGRNRQPIRLNWDSKVMQLQVTDRAKTKVFRRTGLGAESGFGFTSTEVKVSKSSLQIFPNGLAEDTLNIQLAKSGFTRTISVSRAGLVRLGQ